MQIVGVARHKITSLYDELGRNVPTSEMNHALTGGFQRALGIKLVNGELSPHEHELAERLCRQKYATDDWNLRGSSSD